MGVGMGSIQFLKETTEMTHMRPIPDSQFVTKSQPRGGSLLRRLVREESGQSMTEYILILAMVLMIFSKLKKGIMEKVMNLVGKVGGQMDTATEDAGG